MKSEPQKEHRWLERLVGEWTYELPVTPEPGKPPVTYTGTESVRRLGDIWVLCEGRGEAPGGEEMRSVMTLGYDPAKQRYVGTFVGSGMSYLWVYDGEVDETGNRLVLGSDGPSFSEEGKMARYHDTIHLVSDDERTLTSKVQQSDGTWQEVCSMTYRRKK